MFEKMFEKMFEIVSNLNFFWKTETVLIRMNN